MMMKAFTLIELLIVVAIIAILAAIAVPNFLEAQVRAKVSRAKNDLRTVKTAVECYRVDNNAAPCVNTTEGYSLPGGQSGSGRYAMGLTSPIAYISSIPKDPFNVGPKGTHADDPYAQWNSAHDYWYWTSEYCRKQSWGGNNNADWKWGIPTEPNPVPTGGGDYPRAIWMAYSKGPDGYWYRPGTNDVCLHNPWITQYDSTNGTRSTGLIPVGG
ncbi:prepilin-type N-terminal cleavage/methylation domain-containing protein [Candidatus Sumerlaeota bacterium]|nr:prepilin-type N-terminal cleavage/methylation domain-containing protein [Candidatus Sumerlaeales bacterium]NLD61172.1 prepilin-type N-terminal cleavage/methylation domain-containing protein [Candidatus Sumerlaeota bacterium]